MEGEIIPSEAAILARSEGDRYQAAMLIWLEGKAAHTRRSYLTALRAFLGQPRSTGRRSSSWTWPAGRPEAPRPDRCDRGPLEPTGDDPIFTATTDAGRYLRVYYGTPQPEGPEPLTGAAVAQALKRYAAAAGLDPDVVTLRSLRYLGAELWYEASGDLRQTQMFLDHGRLDTTSITMKQLSGEEHRYWEAMVNALGVEV